MTIDAGPATDGTPAGRARPGYDAETTARLAAGAAAWRGLTDGSRWCAG